MLDDDNILVLFVLLILIRVWLQSSFPFQKTLSKISIKQEYGDWRVSMTRKNELSSSLPTKIHMIIGQQEDQSGKSMLGFAN